MRAHSSPKLRTLVAVLGLAATATRSLAAPPASGATAPYHPMLEREGDVVRHPIWGLTITVPGFSEWDHPMTGEPNFVLAGHAGGSCEVTLSMFVEQLWDGATADECRHRYPGNPDAIKKDRKLRLLEEQAAPIAYSRFDQTLDQSPPVVMHQLYGYWTRLDHCFELHISDVECDSAQFAAQAMPILRSVRLSEDTGATLASVVVAIWKGGDPRDWRLHLFIAGVALHSKDKKVRDPDMARRYYESAMRLGGDQLDARDLWICEEGLGISWLMQNDGAKAIPHFERALEIANTSEATKKGIPEGQFNLLCARTVAGDLAAACTLAKEYLGAVETQERKSRIKEIAKDPQLKSLAKSPCYRAFLEETTGAK